MLWFNFILGFYINYFRSHYHTLPYPETKGNKIYTQNEIEPQHIFGNQESVEEFLSVTTVYIYNKATGKYNLYLSKTADYRKFSIKHPPLK